MTHLTAVSRPSGPNRAVTDGRIEPVGFPLDFETVPVLVQAFRRMVRDLAFDVCEMAVTTYLCAREHGVAFTALPVFLVRGFHHGAVLVDPRAGIAGPRDLEGRRVGVNRGYTVTTGVWARGVLAREHGVRLDRVTWVPSGDEHVASYVPPDNVRPSTSGRDLATMLAEGEVDAVVGVTALDGTDAVPLLPDADADAWRALERGHYPINHLLVVRDDVLAAHPGAARAVFDAFEQSKDRYVGGLAAGPTGSSDPADALYARVQEVTGADPLPYGLDANRAVLEELVGHALEQGILRRPVDLDTLFVAP